VNSETWNCGVRLRLAACGLGLGLPKMVLLTSLTVEALVEQRAKINSRLTSTLRATLLTQTVKIDRFTPKL